MQSLSTLDATRMNKKEVCAEIWNAAGLQSNYRLINTLFVPPQIIICTMKMIAYTFRRLVWGANVALLQATIGMIGKENNQNCVALRALFESVKDQDLSTDGVSYLEIGLNHQQECIVNQLIPISTSEADASETIDWKQHLTPFFMLAIAKAPKPKATTDMTLTLRQVTITNRAVLKKATTLFTLHNADHGKVSCTTSEETKEERVKDEELSKLSKYPSLASKMMHAQKQQLAEADKQHQRDELSLRTMTDDHAEEIAAASEEIADLASAVDRLQQANRVIQQPRVQTKLVLPMTIGKGPFVYTSQDRCSNCASHFFTNK